MATTFYITAGLPAIDWLESPPSGDNQFYITAGLAAGDYEGRTMPDIKQVPRNKIMNFVKIKHEF